MKRARVTYSGRVQGVGFRFNAKSVARGFENLTGYVRNRSQGDVEIVCEGDEEVISRFLESLENRMSFNIEDRKIFWEDPKGEFNDFKIRA